MFWQWWGEKTEKSSDPDSVSSSASAKTEGQGRTGETAKGEEKSGGTKERKGIDTQLWNM